MTSDAPRAGPLRRLTNQDRLCLGFVLLVGSVAMIWFAPHGPGFKGAGPSPPTPEQISSERLRTFLSGASLILPFVVFVIAAPALEDDDNSGTVLVAFLLRLLVPLVWLFVIVPLAFWKAFL